MLARDHALSGALAFAAVAPLLHVTSLGLLAGAVFPAGAVTLPDIDEPESAIARSAGFLTGGFAWLIHKVSGGHRPVNCTSCAGSADSLFRVRFCLVTRYDGSGGAGAVTASRWQLPDCGRYSAMVLGYCELSS